MAKRLIISIIVGGFFVLAAHLIFTLVPISIFPCTQTQIAAIKTAQFCSVGDLNTSRPDVIYEFTSFGQLMCFAVIYVLPVVAGFLIEFRLLPGFGPKR